MQNALTKKYFPLDQLFEINEYPVFPGYQDYLREKAKQHAEREWNRLAKRITDETKSVA